MFKRFLLFITLLLLNLQCVAAEDASEIPIPYMTYEYKSKPVSYIVPAYTSQDEVDDMKGLEYDLRAEPGLKSNKVLIKEPSKIFKLTKQQLEEVRLTGKNMCEALGNAANLKLWFSMNSKGELFIVEFSMGAGMEITYSCSLMASN